MSDHRTISTSGGDALSHAGIALSPAEAIKMMCEVSDQNKSMIRRVDSLMAGLSEMIEESALFRDDMRKMVDMFGSKIEESIDVATQSVNSGETKTSELIDSMNGVIVCLKALTEALTKE